MKQYRLQPGTSSRIYYLLTVKDDGTMELVFHGTDRTLTEEASVNADGWIVTKGAMYPPLADGKWKEVECSEIVAVEEVSLQAEIEQIEPNQTEEILNDSEKILEDFEPTGDPVIPAEQNDAPEYSEPAKSETSAVELDLFAQMQMQIDQLRQENDRLCNMIQTRTEVRTAHESFDTENRSCATQGRPSTTPRQRRRRAVAVETPAAQAVALEQDNGNSQLLKALGIAVASIAALVIIYNTGLLIPMGLIGLGASGLLK